MSKKLWAKGIAGGTEGYLDAIDPNDLIGNSSGMTLAAGDVCEVIFNGIIYMYEAQESAGAVEQGIDVIIPDKNAGNFWWKLLNRVDRTDGMLDALLYQTTSGGF